MTHIAKAGNNESMGGTPDTAPVLAIDHDQRFKILLETFFFEFLELFFPTFAATLEPGSLEFLQQEVFANLMDGSEYHADIVVKTQFKGTPAFLIVHTEHQSTTSREFPRRFFRYFSLLMEKYDCPVYPIVIYSHDKPQRREPDNYRLSFADGEVLRFHYRVVQLNRLPWRKFVKKANPVASALMAKMKIAVRDRPLVKLECLRLLLTLRLDPARMRLIGTFVDSYLRLNESEERLFARKLEQVRWKPKEKEAIVEYVTSWEERGIEKGIEKGLVEGRAEGRIEALREILVDVLTTRFGTLDAGVTSQIEHMCSAEGLKDLTHRALTASTLLELGLDKAPNV
ncbi:MAG: Rpn family recombination-promoting nuclease/putative transposase [Acidobacteria bacterium]|nr:Rpn family recombination-promoting nuclease/putative transposase [Acidobacteriota bacterium]